jgi:hypothetical protein
MANPVAPTEGGGRRIPFLADPDNTSVAYLPFGIGAANLGAGVTPGAAEAVTPWGVGSDGVILRPYVADTFVPFDLTTVTTEQLIWNPAAGKSFRLLGLVIKSTVEADLNLLDGTGGSVIFTIGAGDSVALPLNLGPNGILGTVDASLYVTSSASADIAGTVWGCVE